MKETSIHCVYLFIAWKLMKKIITGLIFVFAFFFAKAANPAKTPGFSKYELYLVSFLVSFFKKTVKTAVPDDGNAPEH